MYDNNINEMAELLKQRGIVSAEKLSAAVEALNEYWGDKIAHIWTVDDAYQAGNNQHRVLSPSEACEMLQRILHKADASIGTSWETLESYVDEYGREMTPVEKKKYESDYVTFHDPEPAEAATAPAGK
jgi:hypothetical protein